MIEGPTTTYTVTFLSLLRTEAVDIGITSLYSRGESVLSSGLSSSTSGGTSYGLSSAGSGKPERIGEGKYLCDAGEGALYTLSGRGAFRLREVGRLDRMKAGRLELGGGIYGCGKV